MLVTINNVTTSQAPKGYMIAEVQYTKDGQNESRKIMSFAAPAVYTTLTEMKSFPIDVNVTLEKNGKFWNWTGVEQSGNSKVDINRKDPGKAVGRIVGSNYETPEERARRQVYIIKQSSISSAISLIQARFPKGCECSVEEVLFIAERMKNYVLSVETSDPQEDVPL